MSSWRARVAHLVVLVVLASQVRAETAWEGWRWLKTLESGERRTDVVRPGAEESYVAVVLWRAGSPGSDVLIDWVEMELADGAVVRDAKRTLLTAESPVCVVVLSAAALVKEIRVRHEFVFERMMYRWSPRSLGVYGRLERPAVGTSVPGWLRAGG